MTRTTDDSGRPLMLRTPRQASRLFGLDRNTFNGSVNGTIGSAPRPKFMFMVRFVRGAGVGGQAWREGLTVATKKIDRPAVSVQVQELSQYNKKRLIQTGVKYGPVNIEFHDTADSVVSSMWQEYSSYYFGDQRHTLQGDWDYDVVSSAGFKNGGEGFGLGLPRKASNEAMDLNGQFFFSRIECYQFFGGQYVQFDLVNPKIASFNPDDMDYDSDGSHGIRMTVEYETLLTHNRGVPAPINRTAVEDLIKNNGIAGDVYDIPDQGFSQSSNNPTTQYGGEFTQSGIPVETGFVVSGASPSTPSGGSSIIGNLLGPGILSGALGGQGPMNFGGSVLGSALLNQVIGGDMKAAGKTILNGVLGSGAVNLIQYPKSAITGTAFDIARGMAQNAAINGVPQPGMVGAFAQSNLTGGSVLGALNSARPPTAQVGFRVVENPYAPPRDDPNNYL